MGAPSRPLNVAAREFASACTLSALIIGILCWRIPIANEHIDFFLSAPIAVFPLSFFGWKWTFQRREDYQVRNLIGLCFLINIAAHYLNFVLLGIGRLITAEIFRGNKLPEPLAGTLTHLSLIRAFISLYKIGWMTFLGFVIIGVIILRRWKLKK